MHIATHAAGAAGRGALARGPESDGLLSVEVQHLRGHDEGTDLSLTSSGLGPLTVATVRSSRTAFTRTERLVREEPWPEVSLVVQRTGSSALVQIGRDAVLGPGDLALVISSEPSVVVCRHVSTVDLVRIPAQHLAVRDATLQRAAAVRLGPDVPVAGVLGRFVGDLVSLPRLEPVQAEHLARPTVELVRALIASVAEDSRRTHDALEATLQWRVSDYLRAHWREAGLSADRIAAAHHISTRQVYRLLAAEGISLGDWLRQRRLEACRDELARPAPAPVAVATVGRRWGFVDATNFGRAFKAAYGLTPLEWRSLHQSVPPRP